MSSSMDGVSSVLVSGSQLQHPSEPPGELLKQIAWYQSLPPQVLNSVDLVWGPRIHISNRFPGDAHGSGLRNALAELLVFMKTKVKNKGDLFKL